MCLAPNYLAFIYTFSYTYVLNKTYRRHYSPSGTAPQRFINSQQIFQPVICAHQDAAHPCKTYTKTSANGPAGIQIKRHTARPTTRQPQARTATGNDTKDKNEIRTMTDKKPYDTTIASHPTRQQAAILALKPGIDGRIHSHMTYMHIQIRINDMETRTTQDNKSPTRPHKTNQNVQ